MGLYEKMATAMPKVTCLRCTECGNTRRPRQSQLAAFLAAGWPMCCGLTMRMHTVNDPAPSTTSREGAGQ